MDAVLPLAIGKRKSSTRWPVSSGVDAASRPGAGRGTRTGHDVTSDTSCPETTAIRSSTCTLPSPASHSTRPCTWGGNSVLSGTADDPSGDATSPSTAPDGSSSPSCTVGVKRHVRSRGSPRVVVPGVSQSPARWSTRNSPSYTPPNSPGPSSADSGPPVPAAASPGRSPPVYSYTCTVARSSPMSITSPMRPASPTRSRSNIATPATPVTSTRGPLTRTTRPAPGGAEVDAVTTTVGRALHRAVRRTSARAWEE